MAFPCFDEPSFKANFSVRIRRTSEHISLSNMPVVSVALRLLTDGCVGKSTTLFYLGLSGQDSWTSQWPLWGPLSSKREDEHLPRSFHHLWLQICHGDHIFWRAGLTHKILPPAVSHPSCTGTRAWTDVCLQVSIYASAEKWPQTTYALEVAVKMMDFYEKYFDIPYPLPKQGTDLVHVSLTKPHSISSSFTCPSQIWSPSLTSRWARWKTGVWPPTGRRAFLLIRSRPALLIKSGLLWWLATSLHIRWETCISR